MPHDLQVMRDIQRSGQCAGEVIQQVSDTVYPMYKAFIEPDLNKAEIKVTNNFNPFAGFKEPIQILKTDDSVAVDAAYDVLTKLYPNREVKRVRPSPSLRVWLSFRPSSTQCGLADVHNVVSPLEGSAVSRSAHTRAHAGGGDRGARHLPATAG